MTSSFGRPLVSDFLRSIQQRRVADLLMLPTTSTTLLNSLLEEPTDQRAWRTFCGRYGPAVFRFARRQGLGESDAEEVVADTLAAFFEGYGAGRYDRSRGRIKTWVFGIALNKVRELRRRRKKQQADEPIERIEGNIGAESPDDEFIKDVDRTLAWECLDAIRTRVAPLTYQAFDLYALKGRPAEDVAKLLGIDTSAVYVAKSRVLSRARREYEELRNSD